MRTFVAGSAVAAIAFGCVAGAQAKPSGDGPGNGANAKACQKNGWKTLYRSDGSAFADQDACVSYAAQGGALSTTRYPRSKADCESFGGTYSDTSPYPSVLWECGGFTYDQREGDAGAAISDDCEADGGYRQWRNDAVAPATDDWRATCSTNP